MTFPASPAATVLRPNDRARFIVTLTALPLLFLALPLFFLGIAFEQIRFAGITVMLLQIAAIVYVVLWRRRTRFEYGGGRYLWQSEFETRAFGTDDIEKVVPVDAIDYGLQRAAFLFIVGRTTRRLTRLDAATYDQAALEAVVNELAGRGVPIEPVRGTVTVRQFARSHPGLLRWNEVHRVLFMLAVTAVTLAVLVPIAIFTVLGFVG